MEAAAGWVHFWLGGNASLTTRHLVFIRILLLLLLPCCCLVVAISNVIVHPSVCSSVIRRLTRPHLASQLSFFLLSSHSHSHFYLAHIYAQNLLPFSPLCPTPFPPPVSLLYACLYMCWLAYFPGGDKAV